MLLQIQLEQINILVSKKLWNQLKTPPASDRIYRGYFSVNYKQDIIKQPLGLVKLSIGIETQKISIEFSPRLDRNISGKNF